MILDVLKYSLHASDCGTNERPLTMDWGGALRPLVEAVSVEPITESSEGAQKKLPRALY